MFIFLFKANQTHTPSQHTVAMRAQLASFTMNAFKPNRVPSITAFVNKAHLKTESHGRYITQERERGELIFVGRVELDERHKLTRSRFRRSFLYRYLETAAEKFVGCLSERLSVSLCAHHLRHFSPLEIDRLKVK